MYVRAQSIGIIYMLGAFGKESKVLKCKTGRCRASIFWESVLGVEITVWVDTLDIWVLGP